MFPRFSRLWLDLETFCEVPITYGTHRYAEDSEILLAPFALDDAPAEVIDLTDDDLSAPDGLQVLRALLAAAIEYGAEVWAHNSAFDRTQLRHRMPDVCPPIRQWRDTMVQALMHSLPGGLGDLCDVLGVDAESAKDKRGKQLIQLFCKPLGKNRKLRRATRCTHPAEWADFKEYARLDVEAMRAAHRRAPKWNYPNNPAELSLWHLDQQINDRGVAVDVELARAAMRAVDVAQVELAEEAQRLTHGEVQAATQRQALLDHLAFAHGFLLADLKGSTVDRMLENADTPAPVRELLLVRQQASTTSTAKYKALANAASSDGRLRGLLQFAGASRTARWAGRVFQPQNLPRPVLKQAEIDEGIEWLKGGYADLLSDDLMVLTSSAIRGCLVAPSGRKMPVADLSNIEGRMLAWLSGVQWKLKAFRDYDAGTGHDLYALAYAKSFGVTPETVMENKAHGDGSMRQIGKVQELALGYQGGVGAFVTFAMGYRIDLDDMARGVLENAPVELIEEATSHHEWLLRQDKPNLYGLTPPTFIACEVVKRGWRAAHPETVRWWASLEAGFRAAVESPGTVFRAANVAFLKSGNWLYLRLPSGRRLCYPSPQVDDKGKCSYMGVDQFTRKWKRLHTYGGKLAENVTQAASRDVLAANMPAIEAAGYAITLSVHDELLTETPDAPEYSGDGLASLMSQVPAWAQGLPLAAAGFETYRYKKD